jgi:hypothetical protein
MSERVTRCGSEWSSALMIEWASDLVMNERVSSSVSGCANHKTKRRRYLFSWNDLLKWKRISVFNRGESLCAARDVSLMKTKSMNSWPEWEQSSGNSRNRNIEKFCLFSTTSSRKSKAYQIKDVYLLCALQDHQYILQNHYSVFDW